MSNDRKDDEWSRVRLAHDENISCGRQEGNSARKRETKRKKELEMEWEGTKRKKELEMEWEGTKKKKELEMEWEGTKKNVALSTREWRSSI